MSPPDTPDGRRAEALEPRVVVELLEEFLIGRPTLTGPQVAAAVGIGMDVARERWRSLGFTEIDDDVIAFTEADVEAMRLTERLHQLGLAEAEDESALIRTLGRSFARLAEWQLTLLGQIVDPQTTGKDELARMAAEVLPLTEEIQQYVWRRHLLGAASRMLLGRSSEEDRDQLAVGFADIVGYTRRSRALKREELSRLVDDFEGQAQAIITSCGGRIIKTIGDEVLFVADSPEAVAEIALRLVEARTHDEDFPELRVGAAWGPVLNRLGDVFGHTVNVASRLTSVARPGRVLVDKELADALQEDERFRVRRTRRQSVKGYRRLEPWRLQRARTDDDTEALDPDWETAELPPATAYLHEKGKNLIRAVDEVQTRLEGAPLRKPPEQRPGGQSPGPVVAPDEDHG